MPKAQKPKVQRSIALEKQLAQDASRPYAKPTKRSSKSEVDHDGEEPMPESLSRKTLALAREQQIEEENPMQKRVVSATTSEFADGPLSSDDDDDEEEEYYNPSGDNMVRLNDGYVEEVEVCEADEAALANFMQGGMNERRNLADIIMEKIKEKEARDRGEVEEDMECDAGRTFDPKIVSVYQGVGSILKRYSAGKLPKAFKVIPSLSYWEDILWLTHPEDWSPHSMFAATRLFASNLNPKMAQRFFNIFLLEHVRQDIRENRRLNYHLYMALKKAVYKPQAFFKGIILPLCEGGDCTLREATIIGSVLSKVSIPVIHSAAALLKLAEMSYSGANSMFIRVLLQKKYSLPTRVITALSQHFLKFTSETRNELPVLWHQALLVFAQRYKNNISASAKDGFKALLKQHYHHQITPEVRRELYNQTSQQAAAASMITS